jgi:antirestriction protein ArdC
MDDRLAPIPRSGLVLCALCRYRHKAHWTGAKERLNRETLNNSHGFGDIEYAKEELRAELASVFLMAERCIPHDPDSHAAYLGSWLNTLRDDKHEIFRAARDAHKAADLLIALEHHKSLDQALAHIRNPKSSMEQNAAVSEAHHRDSAMVLGKPAMEMEL